MLAKDHCLCCCLMSCVVGAASAAQSPSEQVSVHCSLIKQRLLLHNHPQKCWQSLQRMLGKADWVPLGHLCYTRGLLPLIFCYPTLERRCVIALLVLAPSSSMSFPALQFLSTCVAFPVLGVPTVECCSVWEGGGLCALTVCIPLSRTGLDGTSVLW